MLDRQVDYQEDDKDFSLEVETRSFSDYLSDMFAFPDGVTLRKINNGDAGFRQDLHRMHCYFKDAMDQFDSEENG